MKSESFASTCVFNPCPIVTSGSDFFGNNATNIQIHYYWSLMFQSMSVILQLHRIYQKGDNESFSSSDSSWITSVGIPASSSSLFSRSWPKIFKVWETVDKEVDKCVLFCDILCVLLCLSHHKIMQSYYSIDLSWNRLLFCQVFFHTANWQFPFQLNSFLQKIISLYWLPCHHTSHKIT